MIENRVKILISSVRKLLVREAWKNLEHILDQTHTADIAAIFDYLDHAERMALFRLNIKTEDKAEILSYLKPETQIELIEAIDSKQAHSLVSLMDSDDAADLLSKLPEELSTQILNSMQNEDKEEVTDLMRYPEDTAGGLMRPDMLALTQELTVKQAIEKIQYHEEDILTPFYLYVVDEADTLVGVVSLKTLLLSKPDEVLRSIMVTDVIRVRTDTEQEEVAKNVERYDFLSLPVVNDTNKLVGVITVDDVIDVIRAEAQEDFMAMGQAGNFADFSALSNIKARLPWLVLIFLGGLACYALVYYALPWSTERSLWVQFAALAPMFLSLAGTAGHQAATVSVGFVQSEQMDWKRTWQSFWREIKISVFVSLLFGSMLLALMYLADAQLLVAGAFAVALALQIGLSIVLGNLIPLAQSKMGIDPTVATVSLLSILSDISSVLVLFGLTALFMKSQGLL
jgi:magnesium transporter